METLYTKRLILRPWSLEDLDDFFEYAKDPDIGPNAGWPPHKTKEESLNILKMFIEEDEVFAIVCKENNKVIGSLGVHQDRKRAVKAKMLGYVLSKDYWGKGFMTEAVNATLKHCFEDLNLDLVSCYHFSFNMRSKKVIERCNFKFEGTIRQSVKLYDGNIYDDCCYSVTKEEFTNINKA